MYNGTDYKRDSTEVAIGKKVVYQCFNGMRNKADPTASIAQGQDMIALFPPQTSCLLAPFPVKYDTKFHNEVQYITIST